MYIKPYKCLYKAITENGFAVLHKKNIKISQSFWTISIKNKFDFFLNNLMYVLC